MTHINKKGRPVSQCPHCRGLRKARAAHVACECGSKPHKKDDCADNDSNKSDLSETQSDTTSDPGTEHPLQPPRSACCCSHGKRCTCALKKEHLDPVSETDPTFFTRKRATSGGKPRLLKTGSDNALTVFTNGHHKPVHKHNDSAHKCGVPYTIPIPHSVSGNADLARRSTDSLPNLRNNQEMPLHYQRNVTDARSDIRMAKSEHGSPQTRANSFRETPSSFPSLNLSYPSLLDGTLVQYPKGYDQSPRRQEIYYDAPEDPPVMSAGLSGTTNWSDLNLPLDSSTYPPGYGQPPSFINLDQAHVGPQPCLTSRSSSGDISDTASDYLSHSAPHTSPSRTDRPRMSSPDSQNLNRLSCSSFTSVPQTSLNVTSNNSVNQDTEFHPATASPIEFEDPSALHADAYERHGFTVHDAQRLAHPDSDATETQGLSSTFVGDLDHLLWSQDANPSSFVSQAMVEGIGAGAEGSLWQ